MSVNPIARHVHRQRESKAAMQSSVREEARLDVNPSGTPRLTRPLEIRFDPMLLGFGLFLAWGTCMPWAKSHVLSYEGPAPTLSVVTHAILLIGLAFACNRRRANLYSPTTLIAGGAATVLAPLTVIAALLLPDGAVPLGGMSILLEGLGLSMLYLLWNEQLARRPQRVAWPAYAAAFAIDPLVYLALIPLPPLAAGIAIAALPIASCFMLWRCAAKKATGFAQAEAIMGPWRFPWRPAALMATFSFVYYMVLHLFGGTSRIGQLGSLLVAGLLLAMCLALFDHFDPRLLYKLCPPLMVCALLSLTQQIPVLSEAGSFIAYAGFTGFSLFMALILSSMCFRYGVHAGWLFGIVEGCNVLAHAVGSLIGREVAGASQATLGIPTATDIVLDIAVVAIVLVSMLLLSERDLTTTWGIRPASEKPGDVIASRDLEWRCSKVARHFGLTHREEEILLLLAQDRPVAEIEAALFISHNTAKGHLRHLYAKLDVHSREEATRVALQWH